MASFGTATTAAYNAQTLRGTTKADKIARADAECADLCTADWANDVDTDLKTAHAQARGTAGAFYFQIWTFAYSLAAATKVYAPISGGVVEGAATNVPGSYIVAPADGEIVGVSVASRSSTAGLTAIAFHKGGAGTYPSANAATESQNVTISAARTSYHAAFSSSTFSKGDLLAIGLDPTGNHNDIDGSIVVKFDTNTL